MVVSPQPGLVEVVLNSAQVPGSRGLWPDTLPTNPVGAVEWPGISWEGLERAFCEPQTPQSFSKYSLPGSLGRGVSFRCGTTASQPSSTRGGRSATVTSLRWSPARGPSVLRGAWGSLAGEGELAVTGAWAGVRGPTISLSHRGSLPLLPVSPPHFTPLLPEPSEVEDFELNFTGGVPGPTSQDLLCKIKDSPSPVVLHIEAAFKVPVMGPGG